MNTHKFRCGILRIVHLWCLSAFLATLCSSAKVAQAQTTSSLMVVGSIGPSVPNGSSGTFSMTVNNVTETVTYCECVLGGQIVDNPAAIMKGLVGAFNSDSKSPVTAQLTGSGVTVTTKNPNGFPIITSADNGAGLGGLGGVGFLGIPIVPVPNAINVAIIGSIGPGVPSGNPEPFSMTVNGVTETVKYCACTQPGVSGLIDSPGALASALVNAFNSDSASPVTAASTNDPSGAVLLTLTSKTSGVVLTVLSSDGGAGLGGLGGINFLALPVVPALDSAALSIVGSIGPGVPSGNPEPFSVTVNGVTETVKYCECTQPGITGIMDNPRAIEQALADAFNADPASPVSATLGIGGLQLTANTLGTMLTVTSADGGAVLGGLSGVNFVGINGSLPNGTGPITGFINPKFVVIGVTYAPPGATSFVSYQNSTLFGTKLETDHSFKNTVTQTVTLSRKAGIKAYVIVGDITTTTTESNTWTQGSSDGKTVDIEKTTTKSDSQLGPADSFVGLDHDSDLVWVWLNPVLPIGVDPNNDCSLACVVVSDGVGFDPTDQPDLDVVPIPVGILNGDIPLSAAPDIATRIARSWASGQVFLPGEGPGLTGPGPGTDFDTIVRFDPFWQCTQTPANCPTTVDSTRFALSDNTPLNYQQAVPGQQPITETLTLDYKNTTINSSGTTTEFSHSFSLQEEFAGSVFKIGVDATVQNTQTVTVTTDTKTDITNSSDSTATASITGPTCTVPMNESFCDPEYTGPDQFLPYVDDKFGTFMFFPTKDPRFVLSVSPSQQATPVGGTVTYTVSSQALDGFTGDVNLSIIGLPQNQGISANSNPPTITRGSGSASLTVTTTSTTPAASSNLFIVGTSGSTVEHIPIVLQTQDFTIQVSPASETVTAGNNTAYDVTITPENGMTLSTLNLSLSGLPSGATGNFSTPTPNGSGGLDSTLSITTTTSVTGGNFPLTVCGAVSGLNRCAASVNLTINAQDFTITAEPPSQTVSLSSSTTYTLSVSAVNGFSGVVSLSLTGLPAGTSATFNPVSINGSGTSTLTVTTSSSTPGGTSTLQITGTSGSLNHSTTVQLVVNATPDFTISVQPQSAGVAQGGTASYVVTTTAINGFTGNVNLTVSGLPANATANFVPNPIAGAGTSTLSVQTTSGTPVGNSTLTIAGASGSLNHNTQATLTVDAPPPDFSISVTPTSQQVVQGACVSYTLTISPLNGFNGPISISLTGLPPGASATFNPTSLTGSGSIVIAICTSASTPLGTYALTVTASSGNLTHSVGFTLVVVAPTPTINSLSPNAGPIGTVVTIRGANFGATQGNSTVKFNGTSATISTWSGTTLVVSVPTGATTGPVIVTVGGTSSSGAQFNVTTPQSFFATTMNSSTSGNMQLATSSGSTGSFVSADLINQQPGDFVIQGFDTQSGVPNESYTWQPGMTASYTVWMQQTSGSSGTLFPEVQLYLNNTSGTPICEAIGNTALTTTNTQYTLSCSPSVNVTVHNSDRYYLWIGVHSTAASSTSLKGQANVGNQVRGRPVTGMTCPD